MQTPVPVQSVLDLNEGSYSRETSGLAEMQGRAYATTNLSAGATALPHFHEDTHLSFLIRGAIEDKRRDRTDERTAGELMFFHAGEPHQSIYKTFPAVNVNLELAPSYLKANGLDEA